MKALFIFGWMLLCSFSSAQVKIGGDPKIIHPHSLLELKSNTKALVLTIVTDSEMQAITPLNGALVFNIDQINNSINLSQYPRSRLVNFQLYDRYGVMLFKLKSMDPKSLKDRIKNNTSYTGTYFYIVHLKAPKQIEQGYIYLIKK